jgi:hypothetical protein
MVERFRLASAPYFSDMNDRRGVCGVKAPGERKLSICRRDAPQEEQAFDIVDEVRQSDPH